MKVIFESEERYLEQIKSWLNEERLKGLNGFYYNFINSNFKTDNFMYLVSNEDEAIGFIDYSLGDKTCKINVAIIKNSEKKKGYGRLLLQSLINRCKEIGILTISLDCVPSSSKKIWKKMGFKEFKEIENHTFLNFENHKRAWLYMILTETEKPSKKQNLISYLELWPLEAYKTEKTKPTYRWDLLKQTKPIIYPADGNWKVKHVKNDEVIFEAKLKYYNNCNNLIGDFLIIENRQ